MAGGGGGLHARMGGVSGVLHGCGECGPGVKLKHASMPSLACGVDVHLDGCLHATTYGRVC